MEDEQDEDGLNNNHDTDRSRSKIMNGLLVRLPLLVFLDFDVLFNNKQIILTDNNNASHTYIETFAETAFEYTSYISLFGKIILEAMAVLAFFLLMNSDLKRFYASLLPVATTLVCMCLPYPLLTQTTEMSVSEMFGFSDSRHLYHLAFVISAIVVSQGGLAAIMLYMCHQDLEDVFGSVPNLAKMFVVPCFTLPALVIELLKPSQSMLYLAHGVAMAPACLLFLLQLLHFVINTQDDLLAIWTRDMEIVKHFGLPFYLEARWLRSKIPLTLRTFWTCRFLVTLVQVWPDLCLVNEEASLEHLLADIEMLMVRGCEGYTALLGMISIISLLSSYIELLFQKFMLLEHTRNSFASLSAVLFLILALQTGLPNLPTHQRFFQLCKNSCLLSTAFLYHLHSMVDSSLIALASSSNNKNKHFRCLFVCLVLVVFSVWLLVSLWSRFTVSSWILAVSLFCVEAVIKVVLTLVVYSLTMWDVYCQDGLWESFDEWIFYIKSFGNSVQFVFAVLIFLNGGWVLLFEEGGVFRLFMMVTHAYYNIWNEAKKGWSIFCKRRTAALKVSSLLDATPEQIIKNDDVCPICYQRMDTAKLTRCSHMFHNTCLKKWLQKQESCPMCLKSLLKVDATSQTETEAVAAADVDAIGEPQWDAEDEVDRLLDEENANMDQGDGGDDLALLQPVDD